MEEIRKKARESLVHKMQTIFESLNDEELPENLQNYISGGFPKELKEVAEFRSLLTTETDRGCALMAVSYLEKSLEELIRSYLVDEKDMIDKVTGANGALATFSAKIDMAYLLGLISKEVHRDLNLIRKIRNEFGHNPKPISFETGSIKNRCLELQNHYILLELPARSYFTGTVYGILGQINACKIDCVHIKPKEDSDVSTEFKSDFTEFALELVNGVIDETLNDEESNLR